MFFFVRWSLVKRCLRFTEKNSIFAIHGIYLALTYADLHMDIEHTRTYNSHMVFEREMIIKHREFGEKRVDFWVEMIKLNVWLKCAKRR